MYPDYHHMAILIKQRQEMLLKEAEIYRLLKKNNEQTGRLHFMVSVGNLLIVLGTKLKNRYEARHAMLPTSTGETILQSEG